jgi:hypothetical protein
MMNITYTFHFASGRRESFPVDFDPVTGLQNPQPVDSDLPEWVLLDFGKCTICDIAFSSRRVCPAANSLLGIVRCFSDVDSHQQVGLRVDMPGRKIVEKTTVQRGLGSLVGLLLATSGCSPLGFFRPMARFHLPLSSEEDTAIRAIGMYLIGEYLQCEDGKRDTITLEGLQEIYQNVETVNVGMSRRLRAASEKDASVNALILLDLFAKGVPNLLDSRLLDFRPLFSAYLEGS